MNKKSEASLYKLIRDLSDVQGVTKMTILCMNAFIETIRQLKCTREEFDSLYRELAQAIKKSQPNIIPLIHLMEYFELDMKQCLKADMDMETVRKITVQSLEKRLAQLKRNADIVTENGLSYVNNQDVIIVHSASTVVINILTLAREKMNREFKVIILDLYPERTRQTVQAMRKAGIEHTVTPAYNLSHHIEKATRMFLGAMTITKDRKIVAPVGTAGTVSLCRLNGVKVHLFANTLHFSHRNSMEQNIFQDQKNAQHGTVDYAMTTHSHDLVSLGFMDSIVTEIGEVSKEGNIIAQPFAVAGFSEGTEQKEATPTSMNVNAFHELSPA